MPHSAFSCHADRATLAAALLLAACATSPPDATGSRNAPPDVHAIRTELLAMKERDQQLEHMVVNGDPATRQPGFFDRKAATQIEHTARCREIFATVGYPDAQRFGPAAADAFWLLVQHSDTDPDFQEQVLESMRPAIDRGEGDVASFAMLVDRVRVNTGRPQLYGSQLRFVPETGAVRPHPIEDPSGVDERRADMGMDPLWKYVNEITRMHFDMNADALRARGIDAAPLVPPGFQAW